MATLPRNVIDVDEVVRIDLTLAPPTIDLTSDVDIDLSLDEPQFITGLPQRSTSVRGPPSMVSLNTSHNANKRSATVELHNQVPKRRRQDQGSPAITSRPPSLKRSCTPHTEAVKVKREVIELDSDGEQIALKRKKLKRQGSTSSDNGSDYSCIHAGYDLRDPRNWKPDKVNEDKLEYEVLNGIQRLTVSSPPPVRHQYVDISDRVTTKRSVTHGRFVWEILQQLPGIRNSRRYTRPQEPYHVFHRQWRGERRRDVVPQMKCTASFKNAPGSINKVAQSGPWVGICSASIGGQPDEYGEEENPYNREGSLMVWNESLQTLPGHCRKRRQYIKHYTVNDLKFDPCSSSSFISSGNDGAIKVWTRETDENVFSLERTWRYKNIPHDIAFKPGESILAVAEKKIYFYRDILDGLVETALSLSGQLIDHNVGAIVWGHEATSAYLFASSEPPRSFNGLHKAFDTVEQKMAYQFDATEAGDAIGVAQDGTKLALTTRGEERSHILRLYDIHRRDGRAIKKIKLKPYPENIEGEVNSAAFSPDGIHLALARNDNHTHIYDSRMLDKFLFDYEHHGPCRTSPGHESYGVVQAQWVERDSKRLPGGLITGGNDGCVRFWDPLRAAEDTINGSVIAETNSDIGCISLGDYYMGERDLIVGDCAGEVSIFEVSHG